ncbi:23S rRNA (adenine(2503)-C(2))-methyltransferase RlmN [Anaeroselena agilis]|uniref:Probable dual-specificity RNA methyltransferase RlmN n=1 Tax=Anaeroselena agilis TaxID=3063788 RepID=A0ABU3NXG8_9FIRM|nr:23S rRNA (adenine(2503)-C(2))-methyltransferase RlmN [Selenomonadales bacterium 4137-cl]
MTDRVNLFGLTAGEMAAAVAPYGLEKYRGRQVAAWLYQRHVRDFAAMTDLPKGAREVLAAHFAVGAVTLKAEQQAADGATSKFLLALADSLAVETVLMRHDYGNSVCVSTQVGCAMGCAFCASTLRGVERDLTAGEILAQVLYAQERLAGSGQKVNSVVIMGSGEPLANYDNVVKFIRLCHEPYCLGLSYRSVTLSTAGVVPGIDSLAAEGLPVTLAISLHAPDDGLRTRLMPVNRTWPLAEVLAAGDRYAAATGRRVTYEYALIAGVNDDDEQAAALAALLKGRLANVNLIPVNPVPERGLLRPDAGRVRRFLAVLEARKVNATVRREMGGDIRAACGQLRHAVLASEEGRE